MLVVQTVCTCHSIVGEKKIYIFIFLYIKPTIIHNTMPRPVSFAADDCFLEIILFLEHKSKCTVGT